MAFAKHAQTASLAERRTAAAGWFLNGLDFKRL